MKTVIYCTHQRLPCLIFFWRICSKDEHSFFFLDIFNGWKRPGSRKSRNSLGLMCVKQRVESPSPTPGFTARCRPIRVASLQSSYDRADRRASYLHRTDSSTNVRKEQAQPN